MANENQSSSSMLQLILAWGFVGIPLAWGVLQTLKCDEAVPVASFVVANTNGAAAKPRRSCL